MSVEDYSGQYLKNKILTWNHCFLAVLSKTDEAKTFYFMSPKNRAQDERKVEMEFHFIVRFHVSFHEISYQGLET